MAENETYYVPDIPNDGMYGMHDHGPGTERHSHPVSKQHPEDPDNPFANDHVGIRILTWIDWREQIIQSKPRPLHVFYYQGGWRWTCRFSNSFLAVFPHTSGPSNNKSFGYQNPGDAADDARRHYRIHHFKYWGIPE